MTKVASTVAKFTPYGMAANAGLQIARRATKMLRKPMRAALTKIAGRKAGAAIGRAIDFANDLAGMPIGFQARALGVSRYSLLTSRARDAGALEGMIYVVESGDTGSGIAQKVIGDASRWRELKAANPAVAARPDPHGWGLVAYPGDRLNLPASWVAELGLDEPTDAPPPVTHATADDSAIYVVKSGDTGVSIAQDLCGDGNRWRELRDANPQIRNRPDPKGWGMVIFPGDRLNVPAAWLDAPEVAPPVIATPPAAPPIVSSEPPPVSPPLVLPPPPPRGDVTVEVGPPEIEPPGAPPVEAEPPPGAPPARSGGGMLPLLAAAAAWASGLI